MMLGTTCPLRPAMPISAEVRPGESGSRLVGYDQKDDEEGDGHGDQTPKQGDSKAYYDSKNGCWKPAEAEPEQKPIDERAVPPCGEECDHTGNAAQHSPYGEIVP